MNLQDKLIEIIKNHPDYIQAAPAHVSIYRKCQQYGGPEEGGWWHTVYELQGSVRFASREAAEAHLESVQQLVHQLQKQENQQHRDAFVMNHNDFEDVEDDFCHGETCGADEFFVEIEENPGALDNTREPIPCWE